MTGTRILDIDRQAVVVLAVTYLVLSLVGYWLAVHIIGAVIDLFGMKVAFLSVFTFGPPGMLMAFDLLPEWSHAQVVGWYCGFTALIVPALVFSRHRNERVRRWAIGIGVLMWLAGGFMSVVYNFAYAA